MSLEVFDHYECDGQIDLEDMTMIRNEDMHISTVLIDIDHLHPHPDNPRKNVGDVSDLADSIKKNGIMQNLTVFPMDESYEDFMVLIGHRRLAACKLVPTISKVPCKVLHEVPSRAKQIEIMLEENMQRNDLTVLEEAESFQLCLDLGETVQDIADKTGFSTTTVRRRLAINKLDRDVVKNRIEDGEFQLTISDLMKLESIEDVKVRNQILNESKSRQTFNWKIGNAMTRQNIAKQLVPLKATFEGLHVEPAPKSFNRLSGDWEEVQRFCVTDEKWPNLTGNKDKGHVYHIESATCFIFRKKDKKQEREADKARKKQQQSEKIIKDKFEADWKDFKGRIADTIIMLMDKRLSFDKKIIGEVALHNALWEAIYLTSGYSGVKHGVVEWYWMGRKPEHNLKKEEKEAALEGYKNATLTEKMLSMILYNADNYMVNPLTYDWKFSSENATAGAFVANIMAYVGFELTERDAEILNGTAKEYKK